MSWLFLFLRSHADAVTLAVLALRMQCAQDSPHWRPSDNGCSEGRRMQPFVAQAFWFFFFHWHRA